VITPYQEGNNMDPSLQDDICICPAGCDDGVVIVSAESGAVEECPNCNGMGHVLCDDIPEGEQRISINAVRGTIRLVTNDDGTITAIQEKG
jgi:hypothetical protein